MAKQKKDYDRYKIEEVLETISERQHSNWGKFLVKASMDDSPSTVDIRNLGFKDGKYVIGKGISLSNDEADTLTDGLVKHGYGHIETIEEEIKKRKDVYYSSKKKDEE